MNAYRRRILLLVLVGLFGLSGASCPQMLQKYTNPQPRLLPAGPTPPTIQQVIDVVNRNNGRIQSFSAENATATIPHYPSLRASAAYQRTDSLRPGRFRLCAGYGLTGQEIDLGSNDELFWFWVRREEPPALYFCRHDQYASSEARMSMPIQPDWLIEAMGIGVLDPGLVYEGPDWLPNDRWRIRTIRNTPEGPVTKVIVLDGAQGWILEQHLSDAQGRLMASAFTSKHRQDPLSGLTMPTVVQVNCPRAKFSMQLDLGNAEINPSRLASNPGQLWTMPSYPNTRLVDLANPANLAQPTPAPSRDAPGVRQSPPSPQASWRRPVR